MLNSIEAVSPPRQRRVLVVEDDQVSRTFLRLSLQKNGYLVIPAESVADAQKQFAVQGLDYFDCVVTDYWMAEQTGLDLLDWLREQDPGLSTIILTGEGEKNLVAEALRRGATDFLEKPVNLLKLLPALEQSIVQTGRQRQLARSDLAVKDLGRAQMWMVHSSRMAAGGISVDVCFHPKLDAGGDFLGHFQITPEKFCCMLTDVSGHDLQAAYISAYFHGIFRGMLSRFTPLSEIFRYFNAFLLDEWNQADQLKAKRSVGTSLAATAVIIDLRQKFISVIICGAPVPVYVAPDGRAQKLGENGGPPLGWFSDIDIAAVFHAVGAGGIIYLWTDGLADLAEAHGVYPLCLAFALQQAKKKNIVPPLLAQADDDILFTAIQLPSEDRCASQLQPLIVESYRGDKAGEIDTLAAAWRCNLRMAVPDLSEAAEHNILLAAREAMLNAFEHGCQTQAEKTVRFQMSYHHERQTIVIHVEDPGTGHQFDFAAHADNTARELVEEHRGLIFIMNLAHTVKFERNGASVVLEFKL